MSDKHDDGTPNAACRMRTICEVLREIADLHQPVSICSSPEMLNMRTRALLREAQTMAKKMARKLLEYNKKEFEDWWAANPDYEADLRRRMAKDYLV